MVTLVERGGPPSSSGSGGGSSIQQRLKSHILKAVADNSAMDHKMAGVHSAREQDQALGDMLRNVRVLTKVGGGGTPPLAGRFWKGALSLGAASSRKERHDDDTHTQTRHAS